MITYPVDAEGEPTEPFVPVVETNTWQALPQVTSGHALGVFCPGNNSYGSVIRYLDRLTCPGNTPDGMIGIVQRHEGLGTMTVPRTRRSIGPRRRAPGAAGLAGAQPR